MTISEDTLTTRSVKIERQTELRDSVALTRVRFLSMALELRPHLVQDLFASTFPAFVFAVVEYFKDRLLEDKQRSATASEAFLSLCKQTIDGIEESSEPHWLANLDEPLRVMIDAHRPQLVVSHLKGQLTEQPLVDLACLPLMRLIGTIRQLENRTITAIFRDWQTVLKLPALKCFKIALLDWSERWNLDADWCRDHALDVLREWLFDEPLRWTFLNVDPNPQGVTPTRNSQLTGHWTFAAKDGEFDVGWSQATLSGEVFEGDPKKFLFQWQGIEFRAPGFNPIIENATEWRRRVELDFRTMLYTRELQRLTGLNNKLDESTDLENQFVGFLQVFASKVSEHVDEMQQDLTNAETNQGLIRVKEKRQLGRHVAWTVRYQIPRSITQGCELAKEIAASDGTKPPAVSSAVTDLLLEIGLRKRRASSGRKPGSKDSLSAQIVRNLARNS